MAPGVALLLALAALARCAAATPIDCDVVIVGGSTAAFAAAIASASEKAVTCLLEPTDWVGGQLTASAVPAIDFAWHKVTDPVTNFTLNVAAIDRDPHNITPSFLAVLNAVGDTGKCWVSTNCFLPRAMVQQLQALEAKLNSTFLRVFRNTVPVEAETLGGAVAMVAAVQRAPAPGSDALPCRFLSQELADWYNANASQYFTKQPLEFSARIFVDASEWGELLALAGAPYLQGIDERFDGDTSGDGNDTCGQSVCFGFTQTVSASIVTNPPDPLNITHPQFYSLEGYSWQSVFTYRRLWGAAASTVSPGDTTVQNWSHGNDEAFGYLLKNHADAQRDVAADAWAGGVDLGVMADAEGLALGFNQFFVDNAPPSLQHRVALNLSVLGTCHGLAKVPYMRDTRRSVGLDGFVMNVSDISGNATQMVGYVFPDRVAIGAYDVDIHPISGCAYPPYMLQYYPVLPFFIPFRALTNAKLPNLIVAGKTMAQSFLVNAATRLHPVEWASGTAAGVAAAFMISRDLESTRQVLPLIAQLQSRVAAYTPIRWNVSGTLYPNQTP